MVSRQTRTWRILLLTFAVLFLSCAESDTAIIVEFIITGENSELASKLEVVIQCEQDSQVLEHPAPYDLNRLGAGDVPSLVLRPGFGEPCTMKLDAQVLSDGDRFPIATASIFLAYEEEEIIHKTLRLDTSSCHDIDDDGTPAGIGGDRGCGEFLDCDDLDENIQPWALELCNGIDDDCNGIVDDLTEFDLEWECSDQPNPWHPDQGLCRFISPRCLNGSIYCPGLLQEDECNPPLDTNCDGFLTGCPCDMTLLNSYWCPPCHHPECIDRETLTCRLNEDALGIGEECVTDGGCIGVFECDPATHGLRCQGQGPDFYEICNNGVDDDCDGFTDEEFWACRPIPVAGVLCPEVRLKRTDPGHPEEHDHPCDTDQIFTLSECGDPSIRIFIAEESNISIAIDRVDGCCECDAHFSVTEGSDSPPAIVITGWFDLLFGIGDGQLTVFITIFIENNSGEMIAAYENFPVTLMIDPVTNVSNVSCDSYCIGDDVIENEHPPEG